MNLSHLATAPASLAAATPAPGVDQRQLRLLARCVQTLATKLDADATVTDTDYAAVLEALVE